MNEPTTIDEYIGTFPEEVANRLQAIRQILKEEAPEAEEAIKYDMPMFVLHGNMLGFAAWKKHIGLYPVTPPMISSIKGLSAYPSSGKGTIQFPHTEPLPLPLIREIVQFRVKENERSSGN